MTRPQRHVILPSTPEFPRHSEATAIQLKNGDILLLWSKFKAETTPDGGLIASDNARAHIAGMVSRDGGQTWGDERVVVENTAGLNVMSPALARLQDGSLGLVYSHRESTTEAWRLFRRSTDEGQTWSEPVRMTEGAYKTGCHDRLIVLDSGRILAPLHCTDDWHDHHLHVRVARSDDNGASWTLSDPIELPRVSNSGESGCIEPDVVQRGDGTVLMTIRTAMGTQFRAESADGGATWTGLRSMEVVSPVAPARLAKLPHSDDLLLIWNWCYDWREPLAGYRRPLAVGLSSDGGNSWPWDRRKILEDDPSASYAYPSCLMLDDRALVTYHITDADAEGRIERSLAVMQIPFAWLYSNE
jgi:sialidase-1